ncbi:hypothetical protein BGZ49_004551 [Haplosporangium sp. Z 27]|nr:hypothetical protein BGZ49_004551 [Haplosporangium sp. Z 27]
MLTKLRLSSMRRDLTRGRSDVSNPPSLSLNSRLTMTLEHPLVLNVTDLVIKVERSTKDSMMDLVRLCPRLTRLGLFLTCLFEVNTLISNLQYLQKQSSRSLPWSLKSIDISVLSSYSDSYFPLIPDEALCSLINCAQWQPDHQQIKEIRLGRGLEKFSADIAFLTKDLVTAIIGEGLPLLPPSSHSQSLSTFQSLSLLPASHLLHESILTDLEIGINSSSTPLNNVRMLREILWSCRRLEKLRIECFCDYLSPPEATLLFCGFDEKGLMDANAAWPCPELRQLKLIGVLILKDMDLIKLAAKDESSSTTNIANVSRGNEEQVSESWMQPQIETGTVEENDTIKIIPEQEEQEEQEQEEQEEDQEEQASYGEDYDEYNYDTWDYDERSGRLDDPALARFADQIIAQVARLPKLDVLILNGTNYTDEITLFRAQKIVQ